MPLEELVRSGTELPIIRWGNPVLHHRCRPVTEFSFDLWNLLCDMFATNRAADGAGLAAPQSVWISPLSSTTVSMASAGAGKDWCAIRSSLFLQILR